jgi:hypothetical protein
MSALPEGGSVLAISALRNLGMEYLKFRGGCLSTPCPKSSPLC